MIEFYHLPEERKKEVIQKVSSFLEEKKEISFAYIFGSFLEENPITFRDIDIGIFLEPLAVRKEEIFDYESNLAVQLSKIISLPVEVIDIKVLNFTSKKFQNCIFSRGLLLFAKDLDFLCSLIEETSHESIINYEFSKESLIELMT